jgi:hypothetical protein
MTSVNMPRDDAALRIDPKAPRARNVNPLEPYPAAQPVQPHEEPTTAPKKPAGRKPQQRRKGERRQKNQPVLLDTRSGGDRRKSAQQETASEDGQATTPAKHIDVYT